MSKQKMRVKVVKPWPSLFVLGVFGVFALLQPFFECRLALLTVVIGSDFRNQMSCKGIDDRLRQLNVKLIPFGHRAPPSKFGLPRVSGVS